MKGTKQKILAAILAVAVVLTSIPVAFALTDNTGTDGKKTPVVANSEETVPSEEETEETNAEETQKEENGEVIKEAEKQPEEAEEAETMAAETKETETAGEPVRETKPQNENETEPEPTAPAGDADPGTDDSELNLSVRGLWEALDEEDEIAAYSLDEEDEIAVYSLGGDSASPAGNVATISHGDGRPYGSDSNAINYDFTVSVNGATKRGYCAIASVPAPDSGSTYKIYSLPDDGSVTQSLWYYSKGDRVVTFRLSAIKLAMMIEQGIVNDGTFQGYYNTAAANGFLGNRYDFVHMVISCIYSGKVNGCDSGTARRSVIDAAVYLNNATGTYASQMAGYRMYVSGPLSGRPQDVIWMEASTGNVSLKKASANPSLTDGNGCYSLAGAVYTVYKSGTSEVVGTIRTNAAGEGSLNSVPAGVYDIQETEAPKGYVLDSTKQTITVKAGETAVFNCSDQPGSDPLNIVLRKVDGHGNFLLPSDLVAAGEPTLEGAEFTIRYYAGTTVTDTPTRQWTLRVNDKFRTYLDKDYLVSGDEFYTTKRGTVTLPLGTVTIEETKAPEGYLRDLTVYTGHVVEDKTSETGGKFQWDSNSSKSLILQNQSDGSILTGVINELVPELHTTALDSETGTHLGRAAAGEKIIDTVAYKFLVDKKTYTLKGTLVDQKTGEPITDASGKVVTAEKTFTPESRDGSVDLEFDLDAGNLQGKTCVVYEEIYKDGRLLAEHKDLNDGAQTIYYPNIKTIAVSDETGLSLGIVGEIASVVDTVKISNLFDSGETFTVKGSLVDQKTGEVLRKPNGKEATAEAKVVFGGNGEVKSIMLDLTYNYLSKELAGKSAVVFEELYIGDVLIASHKDLADEDQTIEHPSIKTVALDQKTGSHTGAVEENETIVDTVSCTNLTPNQEYTLKGRYVDAETGETIRDAAGKEVKAEKTFRAGIKNEVVEMAFNLDASDLAGKTAVVLEELYLGEVKLVEHTDLADEDQTIRYPQVDTTAIDETTGDHVAAAAADCQIQDTVSYVNLSPEFTYRLETILADPETGETIIDADGKQVVLQTEVNPEERDGKTTVTLTFNASNLQGKDAVVLEKLYEGDKLVVVHADLKDEDQTVHFPGIATSAKDGKTGIQTGIVGGTQTIIDRVMYQNLVVGKTYTVDGVLKNRETGEDMLDANGNQITATTTFEAKTRNGFVDLVYELDSTLLAGKTVVVAEDLVYQGVTVASHADLSDEEQSVYYPQIGTTASDASLAVNKDNGTELFNGPTGNHTGEVRTDAVITDVVAYKNLLGETEFTLKGRIVNQETGEAILSTTSSDVHTITVRTVSENMELSLTDKDGKEVKAGITDANRIYVFADIPAGAYTLHVNGTDIPVSYDGAGSIEVAENDQIESVAAGTVTHRKGEPIEASVTFVTEKAETGKTVDGSIDLSYVLDSTALAGGNVVVFETLYYKDMVVASHEDLEDAEQTIHYPKLRTTAVDDATESHTASLGTEVSLTDTVTYENLEPGTNCRLFGTVMVKETGEALTGADGAPVTSETAFVPTDRNGEVKQHFVVDTTDLEGKTLVVFEVLYVDGVIVIRHEDLNDVDQSVSIPKLRTHAVDGQTGTNEGVSGQTTIIDEVSYENLIPGKSYRLSGYLVKKGTKEELEKDPENTPEETPAETPDQKPETAGNTSAGNTPENQENQGNPDTQDKENAGEPLLDKDGNKIYGVLVDEKGNPLENNEFIPESASGKARLIYTIDSSLLKGEDVVVFEDLYHNGILVGTHADIEDETQTVHYPEIHTNASDAVSGTAQGTVTGETAEIHDLVTYKNLLDGEYLLRGTVMDKETKAPVLDENGEEIVVTKPFEVKDGQLNGSVELVFQAERSVVEGKTTVIFEKLFQNNIEITQHEDLDDIDQTVDFPKIRTHAEDGTIKDPDQLGTIAEKTTIVDSVTCNNLRIGVEYLLKGVLKNPETGESILDASGKEITAEKTFTAKEADETVELVYEVDSTLLAGKTVVVAEDLYVENLRIASHADLDDEDQSIHYVSIGTEATVDGSHVTTAGSKTTLVDVVDYSNVVIGKEYTLKGVLMDPETKKPITVGGVEITAEAVFTAESTDGQVEMTFVFDSSLLGGKTVVAFETLYKDGKELAAHADFSDKGQSVEFKNPPAKVNTSDSGLPWIFGGIFMAAALLFAGILFAKKKCGWSK